MRGRAWTLVRVLAVTALAGCGAGAGSGGVECNPSPRISGSPPDAATEGFSYFYDPQARYVCAIFLCSDIEGVRLPVGASAEGSWVSWTPTSDQVGTTQYFEIRTGKDTCGDRAGQSWRVTVYGAPRIEAFTADPAAASPDQSVQLIAVFDGGSGEIPGLGPVQSGVPISSAPLSVSTSFQLDVTNSAGAKVSRTLAVPVLTPPTVQTFWANPEIVTEGEPSELYWLFDGDYDQVILDPGHLDVTGTDGLIVYPSSDTVYTVTATNAANRSISATTSVRVVPPPIIDAFSSTPAETIFLGSTLLTAQFRYGAGTIEGLGAVASGIPVDSGALTRSTLFRLVVQNEAGAIVEQEVLVPITGPETFRPTLGLPVNPSEGFQRAVLLPDDRVLLVGVAAAELFEPATETFTAGPRLLQPRREPAVAALPGGRALVVGGFSDNPFRLLTAEILDPALEAALSAGELPAADAVLPEAVPLQDGTVLIVHTSLGQNTELYDPTDGTFSLTGPLLDGHACVACTRLSDGTVLVVDGSPRRVSEVYDPATGLFSRTGSVAHDRCYFTVAALRDGRVLVAGDESDNPVAEVYEPASGLFAEVATLAEHSQNLASAVLADGRVLLVGGLADGTGSHRAQLFDPATDSVRETGGLLCGRTSPVAVSLPDGRVLVAGASTDCPAATPEIYQP